MLPARDQAPYWRRRRSWLAIALSVAIHVPLLFVVIHGRLPDTPVRPSVVFIAPPEPDLMRVYPMPYSAPRPFIGRGIAKRPLPPDNPVPIPRPVVTPTPPASIVGPDTVVSRAPVPLLGPELGDGRLWVRPLPLPPAELASRLTRTHAELVDSAVKAIIQQFLDSVATEPGADNAKLPDWTTKVAGVKFGLDSKNIYIAGLKIPAAVLALLPIPASGNQQDAFKRQNVIYEDLQRASQRATTLDEFKEAIRELRREKQRELDLQRAQREDPDSAQEQNQQ